MTMFLSAFGSTGLAVELETSHQMSIPSNCTGLKVTDVGCKPFFINSASLHSFCASAICMSTDRMNFQTFEGRYGVW